MKNRDRILFLGLTLVVLFAPFVDVLMRGCISVPLGTGDAICGEEAFRKIYFFSFVVVILYLLACFKFDIGIWLFRKRKK